MKPVAIVGGGPVGTFLALALLRLGITPHVFERRRAPRPESRSIGIHPPSLELLEALGLAEAFVARGVRVRRAQVFGEAGPLGSLDFDICRPPFRYVLALPQAITERLLREALETRAPGSLRAEEIHDLESLRNEYAFVVGCDGKRSIVREALRVSFRGRDYDGEYRMADFPDTTTLGSAAAIYLDRKGLLESFPLPGGLRRWVARGDGDLAARVHDRTGNKLDPSAARHASTFRAERGIASRFVVGNVALAGDAAHVVSPIGGQGMNLGWIGAASLARAIATGSTRALAADGRRRRRMAMTAARRAELNMWLGRPGGSPLTHRMLAWLLATPARFALARLFSMRGLAFGV